MSEGVNNPQTSIEEMSTPMLGNATAGPITTSTSTFDIIKFISQLPRVELQDLGKERDEDRCSICYISHGTENLGTFYQENPVKLPCSHIFGRACISKWLKPGPEGSNSNTCPNCRYKLFEPWPPVIPARSAVTEQATHRAMLENAEAGRYRQRLAESTSFNNYYRWVEEAGFHTESFRSLGTAAERQELSRQQAANRRRVAVEERKLYTALCSRGFDLPNAKDLRDALLDAGQDQALFQWLQSHFAFSGVALNEKYRNIREDPLIGNKRCNAQIHDILRNRGIFWEIGNDRNFGRWRNRDHYTYSDGEEDETILFRTLDLEGAFATPGIRRVFQRVDKFKIFRMTQESGLNWNSVLCFWTRGTQSPPLPMFGDGYVCTAHPYPLYFTSAIDLRNHRETAHDANTRPRVMRTRVPRGTTLPTERRGAFSGDLPAVRPRIIAPIRQRRGPAELD